MTADLDIQARDHLLRSDGQEDVCLTLYSPSTGQTRDTAALTRLLLPRSGERSVHGNASFTGQYVVRAASEAAKNGLGIALMHSHPTGTGWQGMSGTDHDTEKSYARVAQTITGLPLLGMTVAGDAAWSARFWQEEGANRDAENVRVVGPVLRLTWNDAIRPAPAPTAAQVRTVSAWGDTVQASLARLRVLVVGVGTVGLDLAIRLVQAGVQHVSVMDFDTVEVLNLDRLITASRLDAALFRSKIYVALRAMRAAATTSIPKLDGYELSVCETAGLRAALDHDVIFSCVDRPWARAVLNQIAYTDLIPVIDGGLTIDPFRQGGMRNATWRAHVITPGRPCMQCTGQMDGAQVARDRAGLFDDQTYIKTAQGDRGGGRGRPASRPPPARTCLCLHRPSPPPCWPNSPASPSRPAGLALPALSVSPCPRTPWSTFRSKRSTPVHTNRPSVKAIDAPTSRQTTGQQTRPAVNGSGAHGRHECG